MAKKKIITPSVPRGATLQEQVNAMIEALEVREGKRGDALDSFVTYRDLVDKEVISKKSTSVNDPSKDTSSNTLQPDPDIVPPSPTNLSASGAIENVILDWDDPKKVFKYFAFTEIYRNTSDDLANAQLVGTSRSPVYADNVPSYNTYYYWIRHVNTNNRAGQFNATAGTSATTNKAGTGDLQDSAVDTIKIADAAIVDAKISDLSATKINAGSLKSLGWSTSSGVKFDLEANSGNGAMWFGGSNDPILYWDGSKIKLSNKGTENELTISGEKLTIGDTQDGDYCVLDAGDIDFYRYINGGHRQTKSLKRIDHGICSSEQEYVLTGYWKSAPIVHVSPNQLQSFESSYSDADQEFNCYVKDVYQTSTTGEYAFVANGELQIASTERSHTVNDGGMYHDCNTPSGWTTYHATSTYTTDSATVEIAINGYLWNGTRVGVLESKVESVERTQETLSTDDTYYNRANIYIDGSSVETINLTTGGRSSETKNFLRTYSVSQGSHDIKVYFQHHENDCFEYEGQFDYYVEKLGSQTKLADGNLLFLAIGE